MGTTEDETWVSEIQYTQHVKYHISHIHSPAPPPHILIVSQSHRMSKCHHTVILSSFIQCYVQSSFLLSALPEPEDFTRKHTSWISYWIENRKGKVIQQCGRSKPAYLVLSHPLSPVELCSNLRYSKSPASTSSSLMCIIFVCYKLININPLTLLCLKCRNSDH